MAAEFDGLRHEQRAREWREVTEQRQFLAAMPAAVSDIDGPEREDLVAYLEFAWR